MQDVDSTRNHQPHPLDPFVGAIAERLVDRLADTIITAVADSIEGARQKPALIRSKELAHTLSVSAGQVTKLKNEGMPHTLVGQEPRYSLAECLEWLRTRRGRTGAAGA